MDERYIARVGNIVTELRTGNEKVFPMEQMHQEQRELSGEQFDLVKSASQLSNTGRGSEALSLIRSDQTSFENPYVRVLYATIANGLAYELLKRGMPRKAFGSFEEAKDHADLAEDKFNYPRWNYEIDALRFNTRKHLGDCLFDLDELDEGEKHYLSAIEVWNRKISERKEVFSNTVIVTHLNLGNLYVSWAKTRGKKINPLSIISGSKETKDNLETASRLAEIGIATRHISRQLKKQIECEIPGYDQAFAYFEKHALEIKSTLDMLRGNMGLLGTLKHR